MADGQFRLRIRYKKGNRLRFLSHLELIRAQERMIRRADLPYAVSSGFSPRMKIAFGPALGVGTAGDEEYLDLWLTRYIDADEVLTLLRKSCVTDLKPDKARYISPRADSLAAELTIATYAMTIDTSTLGDGAVDRIESAIAEILAHGEIEVVRKHKMKTLSLESLLVGIPRVICGPDTYTTLEICTRSSNNGSLRPEVFLGEIERIVQMDIPVRNLLREHQYVETKHGFADPFEV
ncbi:MAG: DUF2344 domain-containing protein [Actinobacteria bacterium]|nr:DUF2344 domain-containing protein [Actinomycetota bacterium]